MIKNEFKIGGCMPVEKEKGNAFDKNRHLAEHLGRNWKQDKIF